MSLEDTPTRSELLDEKYEKVKLLSGLLTEIGLIDKQLEEINDPDKKD